MLTRGTSGRPVRAVRAPAAGKGAARAREAAQLCRIATFQEWVETHAGAVPQGMTAEAHAAEYVRRACGIKSRSELDHNAQAETWFRTRICHPFQEWRRRRG